MRRGARIAIAAGLALAVALAAAAAAFLWGVAVPGEFLRAPLERALTEVFGMPTRIEGPLRVRTGLVATASADALVLADPLDPAGAPFALAAKPAAQVDLVALAGRAVALREVAGERLELKLARAADGRGNWAPIFATSPDSAPSAVAFAGIVRLRVETVRGTYRASGDAAPTEFEVSGFDGALSGHEPTTARGTARFRGHPVAFDLRTASLAELQSSRGPIPVQGSLEWSGARIGLDGAVSADGTAFSSAVQVTADDADPLLAALGVAAREAGALDARGRLRVTGTDASAADLVLKLGASAATGNGRVAWGAPRVRLALDAAAELIDLRPFLAARPAPGTDPLEGAVGALEGLARGMDAEATVTAADVTGLVTTVHEVKAEGRAAAGVVSARATGIISGTQAEATLDFDARQPKRVLSAQLKGGTLSSGALPREARPAGVSGTLGGIRGQLRAQGATPRAIVEAMQGFVEARDVRWTLDERGKHPVQGRFDIARLSVQGARASSAEISGRLGDGPCSLKVSGGALGPLFGGERWPLKLAASCGAARLQASGQIARGEKVMRAELAFDASASRIGPLMKAFGIPSDAPHPAAARGTLALDEQLAHVRLDALRLGRTAGSGEVAFPVGGGGVPRVRLALTTVNLDEINALTDAAPAPSDPLEREILRENLRLPDADFEIAADRVEVADAVLRRLHVSGAMRAGRLPPARFRFESEGMQVSGELGADFSGAAPRVQLGATAQNADLGPLLARIGQAGIALRAGEVSLRARAEGTRLGELLAGATLDAAIGRGQFDLARRPGRGLSGRGDISATLKAAPGRAATLAARGTMDGEPLDLALDTPGLAGLARAGEAIPATLRVTLGDARLQASGKLTRDATGEGRVQLSGGRLDRLGKLIGMELPEVGPYAASGTVAVSADAVRASDLDVSFGKSRILGRAEFQVKRAGRSSHSAALRAPMLHLEDMGAARWLGGPARPKEGEAPAAKRTEAEIARALELLRASDVDATVEVDALHGGAERFASGRLRATLAAGTLRLQLEDVRTASGAIDADLRIDASGAQPKFGVRARVDALEFGPLVRTLDPATKLGGRLDLVADLAAEGPPGQLLPALTGTLDVALFPHDLRSEVLAFWGTGLLSTMLRSLDPSARSEVECAVASLDVNGGLMSTTAFFFDTTRARIVGQIDANLTTRALSGRLRPVSKQPELFTVAPTMVLGGTIESPGVTVAPENVVLAPLRFATPLAGFALDWLSAKGGLREGAASCREAFERARQARRVGGAAR